MRETTFGVLAIGQRFSLHTDGEAYMEKITPRRRSYSNKPCGTCGEPAATWVNAKGVAVERLGMHACPNERVWVED